MKKSADFYSSCLLRTWSNLAHRAFRRIGDYHDDMVDENEALPEQDVFGEIQDGESLAYQYLSNRTWTFGGV